MLKCLSNLTVKRILRYSTTSNGIATTADLKEKCLMKKHFIKRKIPTGKPINVGKVGCEPSLATLDESLTIGEINDDLYCRH